MRFPVLLLAALACAPFSDHDALSAQSDLARRVSAVRDGTVHLRFATRPEICGDGRGTIIEDLGGGQRRLWTLDDISSVFDGQFKDANCHHTPVDLVATVSSGSVSSVRPIVGGYTAVRGTADLGTVAANDAARWLVSVAATTTSDRVAQYALLGAGIADRARISGDLLAMARDRRRPARLREAALKWLAPAADREGNRDAGRAVRAIAEDETDDVTVRERALRVIAEGGAGDEAANVRWLRDFALNDRELVSLREGAIRVLGEELGRPDEVRALYPRLTEPSLQERVVRLQGEIGNLDSRKWLQGLAEDSKSSTVVRERAIRVLAERGDYAYLRSLFGRLSETTLRERIIRLLAEAGGSDALQWLRALVLDANHDVALRERALRSLSEAGAATTELGQLYDRVGDRTLRERIINLLADRNDAAARAKLEAIAKDDGDYDLRRRATRRLAERS